MSQTFSCLVLLTLLSACSITKPCSEAGDVSWSPKIIGDKRCTQKTRKDGTTVNHGKFLQSYSSTGRIALEGEFTEGFKSGIWLHYAEDGRLVAVKYFDRGVEKSPSEDIRKKMDLLIQQKTGSMK
jgi:hypothetical protein